MHGRVVILMDNAQAVTIHPIGVMLLSAMTALVIRIVQAATTRLAIISLALAVTATRIPATGTVSTLAMPG